MNLLQYKKLWSQRVPHEISKKVICNILSPCISINSTIELDSHIQECLGIESLYLLFSYFGDYIKDRDQISSGNTDESRLRSNSLFQRQSSHCIRFQKPLSDMIEISDKQWIQSSDIEMYLSEFLHFIEDNTSDESPFLLLKHSIYHKFVIMTSSFHLSPYNSFNHPIITIFGIDITKGQDYELCYNLLSNFKNLNNNLPNFPNFININDILPVFILCYDESSKEQYEKCQILNKSLKKQLFVESILLPIFTSYEDDELILYPPATLSLYEQIYSHSNSTFLKISSQITQKIYDSINLLVNDIMIPFMNRKISFWDETILQSRKSIFHSNKLFRKFMSKPQIQPHLNPSVNGQFSASSNEFLLRKLADWSFMLADYKTAYYTYDILSKDFENFSNYLAPCLEACAVSILMGAQTIITAKMIKTEIDPLIVKCIDQYSSANGDKFLQLRCLLIMVELFLSLSDTWTSSPYAIAYLESILDLKKLGPLASILIWERISFAYELRNDPRIHLDQQWPLQSPLYDDKSSNYTNVNKIYYSMIQQKGLTRNRKRALFQLLAAKKWREQNQKRQCHWSLISLKSSYDSLEFTKNHELLLYRLKKETDFNTIESKI